MPLELDEIQRLHDKAYIANQQTRIKAADDRMFARVTQWDSSLLQESQLTYKGEFDIITKARKDVMADLRMNVPQVEFHPKNDEERGEESADLINGLYLTDDRLNSSQEAYKNADEETVDCGLGGWELYTDWLSSRSGDRHQVIRRRPIFEFNNNAFPDPNAKLIDKSDALYWSILEPYTLEGYKELYRELTGEESSIDDLVARKLAADHAPTNFGTPEVSYVFPWFGENETYYIGRFYHREKVKDRVLTFVDPLGNKLRYLESSLSGRGEHGDIDLREELEARGYERVGDKGITRWEVTCYYVSGEAILQTYRVPGEVIPVVPQYGERAYIEGEEVWEGIVRRAKDPQRLRNFMLSYVGDIAARGSREKPIMTPEQVAGFENMYAISGADNNYPYVLQHWKSSQGEALPLGPVGTLPATEFPPAVPMLLQATREAVEDVANSGLPKDLSDVDLSGIAIEQLHARLDNQSQVFLDHKKFAKRHDAAIYAGMAAEIYDAPRKVSLTLPDGTTKETRIMDYVLDEETGEIVTLNDLTNAEFEVYATIGPTYSSKRDKTFRQIGDMIDRAVDPKMKNILFLKQVELLDGVAWDDVKKYAAKELIAAGVREPQNDEEMQFAEQLASQPQEPSPDMVLAMAEQKKAEAALLQQQREAQKDAGAQKVAEGKLVVDAFNAETKRQEANAKAHQAGVTARLTKLKATGQQIQNIQAITAPFRARVSAR
jgi:hypothetical protein